MEDSPTIRSARNWLDRRSTSAPLKAKDNNSSAALSFMACIQDVREIRPQRMEPWYSVEYHQQLKSGLASLRKAETWIDLRRRGFVRQSSGGGGASWSLSPPQSPPLLICSPSLIPKAGSVFNGLWYHTTNKPTGPQKKPCAIVRCAHGLQGVRKPPGQPILSGELNSRVTGRSGADSSCSPAL